MQPLQDQTAFDWLLQARARLRLPDRPMPASPAWPGILVSDLVPSEFEAYARILHHVEASYDEIDNPLSASEKEILTISDCEPLRSFLQRRRTTRLTARIRWRELAALLNLPFAPEISFNWFRARMNGWCLSRLLKGSHGWPIGLECEALCSLIEKFCGNQDCFFRLPDHALYAAPEIQLLLKDSIKALPGYLRTQRYPYFEYWWPADRQWCLCDDDDVGVTILGGPQKLVSALMTDSVLECVEVKPTTRVDDRVPLPNP